MPTLEMSESALPFLALPNLLESCAAPVAHWYLVECDAEELKGGDGDDVSLAGSGGEDSSPYLLRERIHSRQEAIEGQCLPFGSSVKTGIRVEGAGQIQRVM